MNHLRKYGNAPFRVAVVHGKPGAPGEMAPVARELSETHGVVELFQTKSMLEEQVGELKGVLEEDGEAPIAVVGFSWGALLGLILAARNPSLVRKLMLVGSPPFEDRYAAEIMKT